MPESVMARDELQTPVSLLVRLRDGGNDSEWGTFWRIYGPFVFRLACKAGIERGAAEDVVAVVMRNLMLALRKGLEVSRAKGYFRAYVATATRRAVIDRLRAAARPAAAPLDEARMQAAAIAAPDDELARLERIERLNLCLERLRSDTRLRQRDLRAFERYVLQSEPAAVVARDLDLTPARLHSIRFEMLRRIEKLMTRLDVELGEV